MKSTYPELEQIGGTFTDLGAEYFSLTTGQGTYRVALVRGCLSRTETIGVIVTRAGGQSVKSFDLIRTHTKAGCRVNMARMGSWSAASSAEAVAAATEALTRHYVARFERCNPALFAS